MTTIKVFHAKTLLQKTQGLIGKNPSPLFFQTRFGIHTLGMQYPIDIVILDEENTVVKLKESLKPNSIFVWNPLYKNILELPEGTIQEKKLKRGTKITLEEVI